MTDKTEPDAQSLTALLKEIRAAIPERYKHPTKLMPPVTTLDAVNRMVADLDKLRKARPMNRREVLLLASYCGDENPDCSDKVPCPDCLAMCNVYEVDFEGARYLRSLAPGRASVHAWKRDLIAILRPLAGKRPLSKSRFDALAKLAGATWLVGRRRGTMLHTGSPQGRSGR